MNPEQYLEKQLSLRLAKKNSEAGKLQRAVIAGFIKDYNDNNYLCLDDAFTEAKASVDTFGYIGNGTTARMFADNMDVHIATARKMLCLAQVSCNKSKRPYIYTLSS